jgi:hypothetical protein
MDLGGVVQSILDYLFGASIRGILEPFITAIQDILISPEAINKLLYVDALYNSVRTIAIALLILITSWQSFKSMFAWAGFEAEEPIRIAIRSLVMGFIIWYAKDVLMVGVNFASESIGIVLNSVGYADYNVNVLKVLMDLPMQFGLLSITAILSIYVIFKSVGLFFKMFERLIFNSFLIICSPLAFACGVAQPTKGFLTGFIRVYVGNLVIQLLQMICLAALGIYWANAVSNGGFVHWIVAIGIIKIVGKLEDIVRDMSISVGVGRDMNGALSKLQSTVHVSQSVVGLAKAFVK